MVRQFGPAVDVAVAVSRGRVWLLATGGPGGLALIAHTSRKKSPQAAEQKRFMLMTASTIHLRT